MEAIGASSFWGIPLTHGALALKVEPTHLREVVEVAHGTHALRWTCFRVVEEMAHGAYALDSHKLHRQTALVA